MGGERERVKYSLSGKEEKADSSSFVTHFLRYTERETNRCVVRPSRSPAPRPLSGWGLAQEGFLRAASRLLHSQREAKPVSCTPLLLYCFSSLFFFILSSSLLLWGQRSQYDAGGVHHGGVRCSCSRPTSRGGHLGLLGRPLQTSQKSQTGGRSVISSLEFFLSLTGLISSCSVSFVCCFFPPLMVCPSPALLAFLLTLISYSLFVGKRS